MDDTKRLKFLADALNESLIHLEVRNGIARLYTKLSNWIEAPMHNKISVDDLRFLIDTAMETDPSSSYLKKVNERPN